MTVHYDETLIRNIVSSVYHITLLVYDQAGTLQEPKSQGGEGAELLFTVTGCKERLLQLCQQSLRPQVISSELNQVWAGLPVIVDANLTRMLVIGPVYTSEISQNSLTDYARSNKLPAGSRERLLAAFQQTPIYAYIEFARLIAMVYYLIYREGMDISLLATAGVSQAAIEFSPEAHTYERKRVYDEKTLHATYAFEQQIWECIREGKLEKLKRHLLSGTYGNVGPIANNDPIRQQKNTFICAVTLATRAAIEGGLSPEVAYSLSDLYIQQVETMKDVLQIMTFTEVMLYDFATRVSNRRRTHSYSKMVNDCCSFIDEHVRERLRVSQVAASIGFNADYASKRFKGETGRSIGEYVKEAKISEARSLLKYSELSIAEISELLSFSSQSFFTSVFRQVTGVTPGQYREKARQ
jgi:AraC-like DNA-binding protein